MAIGGVDGGKARLTGAGAVALANAKNGAEGNPILFDRLADGGIIGMAQIYPFQIRGTAIFSTGLVPLGCVQPAAGQIFRRIGNKHKKADIGAVIGDIGGFFIRHHLGQLHGGAAHGIVLYHLGIAGHVHAHLHRIAIAVRLKHPAEICHRGALGIGVQAKVAGHGLIIVFNLIHTGGRFGEPGIVGVLLAAQMGHPGADTAGTGHPQPAHARHVDISGADSTQLASGFVLIQLGYIHGTRAAFKVRHHKQLVANGEQGAKVVIHGNMLRAVLVLHRLACFIKQETKNAVSGLVAAAQNGVKADLSGFAVYGNLGAGQDLAFLLVCGRKGHCFKFRHPRCCGFGNRQCWQEQSSSTKPKICHVTCDDLPHNFLQLWITKGWLLLMQARILNRQSVKF